MIPQLRVRTEYNFRETYGPIDRVADRLTEMGCGAAGIVDMKGTWGHVRWEQELTSRGIQPMFGVEYPITLENGHKPTFWALAIDLPRFYRMSTALPRYEADLVNVPGVLRFAGGALTDPETFDYIDINPRSRRQVMKSLELSRRTGKPLVVTSDNDYPAPDDRSRFLAWNNSLKMTPQHILSDEELRNALWYVGDKEWNQAVRGTFEVAERLQGAKLAKAPIIAVPGDLRELVNAGKQYRIAQGHIPQWTSEYEERMNYELKQIRSKKFDSYFIIVADMITWAKEHMLVGPGRGSSAGSLVCYLLRITEVDPLVHNLIFERFIDVNRSDLPDIDVDFNDQKREQVFQYLSQKYGSENTCRIGNVNRLKPRSVIAHVSKKLGIPHGATFGLTNVLIEYSSGDSRYGHSLDDTFTQTQPGKDFLAKYPEAKLIGELENHASHSGVHAAGFIVSNVPVVELCTVRDGIAQIDKADSEYLGMLKIDVLGLRTLGVIEDANCVTAEELYGLTLDDPEVFRIYNDHKYVGVFQFEGAAQRRVAAQIPIKEFKQIDHITALARPGPFGGGASNTYIKRLDGKEPVTYRRQSMERYLGETLGVVLYQEQVMRISFEIGKFSWAIVAELRKAMSGSKGTEYFNRRGEEFVTGAATLGLSEEEAKEIWAEIVTFGAWGMNKSHTVSYAIISYWCAHMKRYHPLEYAAALLRNAKDDEQTIEMLRELRDEGITYTPFDPDLSEANWAVKDGELLGGYTNLIGIGPVKAAHYIHKRTTKGLTSADRVKLSKLSIKHSDLSPAHTLWSDIYEHPENYNIHGPVKQFAELEDREDAVVVCRVIRLERRDENEAMRLHRRGHRKTGQTLFLDAFVVDDSLSKPVLMRIRTNKWFTHGEKMADRAVPGQDWFLVRGTWLGQFSMLSVDKIKCLTNERMFL